MAPPWGQPWVCWLSCWHSHLAWLPRFDARKQMVLKEANAIGTTYLRAAFLPEQARNEVCSILREYTAHRAGGGVAIMTPAGREKSATLPDRLCTTSASGVKNLDSELTALYIKSANQTIDLDAGRVTALRNRIPVTIWLMLAVVTIFSMASLGYEFGLTGVRSWAVTLLLVIAFAAVITLIADLDRPQAGLIRVNQQPLIDLLNQIGPLSP